MMPTNGVRVMCLGCHRDDGNLLEGRANGRLVLRCGWCGAVLLTGRPTRGFAASPYRRWLSWWLVTRWGVRFVRLPNWTWLVKLARWALRPRRVCGRGPRGRNYRYRQDLPLTLATGVVMYVDRD